MAKTRLFLASIGRRTPDYPFTSPPMGILYLAAYLRQKFPLEVRLLNQRAEDCSDDELIKMIVDDQPDVVGFSVMTTCSGPLADLTRRLKQALPKTLVLVGGPHASSFKEKVLADTEADVVVVGEGELAFESVLQAWFDGKDFQGIPGLIWRTADRQVMTNPGQTPLLENLDLLPFPAYDLIDVTRYWKLHSLPPIPRRRYLSLFSSRGCPYHCIWCHNVFGKGFRAHSPERIVEEITHFTKTYGVRDIEFLDDIFNLNRKRVVDICQGILQRDLRIKMTLSGGVRTDILTREVVDALADAGLYFGSFALETGSPRVQELTGKRLNIPNFLNGIKMAAGRGIFCYGFAMFGHPTETEAELQQTIDTMASSKAHIASFFTVIPFPGTPLYDLAMQRFPERLNSINYQGENYGSIRVNLSDVPDEMLFAYQRKAYRQFYLKPGRVLRIIRDYPKPYMLPAFLPVLLTRATKGLFGGKSD